MLLKTAGPNILIFSGFLVGQVIYVLVWVSPPRTIWCTCHVTLKIPVLSQWAKWKNAFHGRLLENDPNDPPFSSMRINHHSVHYPWVCRKVAGKVQNHVPRAVENDPAHRKLGLLVISAHPWCILWRGWPNNGCHPVGNCLRCRPVGQSGSFKLLGSTTLGILFDNILTFLGAMFIPPSRSSMR